MSTPTLPMIPIPSKVTSRGAGFSLSATTEIEAADALRRLAERLRDELRQATEFALPVVPRATGPRISLAFDDGLARLGDEGYRLAASADAVAISAARTAGVMHGTQTLRQLLPPAIFRRAVAPDVRWDVPGVEIEDTPRFSWRGGHLDGGRPYMPQATVRKHIDLRPRPKLEVFHLHHPPGTGRRTESK